MVLDELSLSEILPISTWQSAPVGRLLLVAVEQRTEIALRWDWPIQDATVKSLLIVAGNNAGRTIIDAALTAPALDLSELIEIIAKNPAPFSYIPGGGKIMPGMLFEYGGKLYVWFEALYGTGSGFVCVAPSGSIAGFEPGLKAERIGISRSIDVRCKVRPSSCGAHGID
jgi:hypothetical protein